MAIRAGRNVLLKRGTDTIAGVRMLSISYDATFIDVTNADSNAIRTILAGESASRSCTIKVSGVLDSTYIRADALNPASDLLFTDITLTDPGAPAGNDVLSGSFFLTNFTQTGSHDDAVLFDATLESGSAWSAA